MAWFTKLKESTGKFFSVVKPYFSSRKSKERLGVISAWVGAHLLEFAINAYFVSQAESDNVEQSVWRSLVTSFGNIAFSGSMYAFKIAMSNYMIHSITESLVQENALEGWLGNNASVGIEFMQTMEQGQAYALSADTPVERILGEHIKSFSKGTVKLTVENISRILSSAVGLYVIGSLANINTAFFYLAVGGGLVTVCCKLDKKRIDMALQVTAYDDTINARLTHIRERAPQILALQGEQHEIEKINEILAAKRALAKTIFKHEGRNNSIMYVTFFGLAPLLSTIAQYAPSVLKAPPTNSVAALLFQQHVFQLMINFFIAMENYTQEYPKFGASLDKVYSLQKLLALWRETYAQRNLVQDFSDGGDERRDLVIQNLSVSMPTREQQAGFRELLKNTSITLTPGQYRLLGASNAGKSTSFKAIMGIWPHTTGTVIYPCKKNQIRFVPQETFIPYDPTLFDMLVYPNPDPGSVDRDHLIYLLTELNLSHLITTLDDKRDLKMLSRGEQQRLAIISAIISRPKILLLDEATASIDAANKRKVERLLEIYLPDTLTIIIDHSPLLDSAISVPQKLSYRIKETGIKASPKKSDEREEKHFARSPSASITIDIELEERTIPQQQKSPSPYIASHARHFKPAKNISINGASKQLEFSDEAPSTKARRKSI